MIKKYLLFILIIPFILLGCSNIKKDKELQIITSISILADITQNIVGDKSNLDYLVPIGVNPEDYEALPSDIKKISNANILLLNGWGLEENIKNISNHLINNIIYLTNGIEPIYLINKKIPDPHAWLDVTLVKKYYLKNILDALILLDPDNKETYIENANIYIEKLNELDNWIKEKVQKIPLNNKIIITNENALKYYGKAYGFKTEGIWEINAHEEGTPKQIARIINIVNNNNIPALFQETTLSDKYMKIINNETNVPILYKIYTDALSQKESNAETYIKMMKHNTNIFINGLSAN